MGLSKNIAYRLRTLREAAGLSPEQVAERADLSLSLVSKLERGRKADPRASTLLALATALGVRPGQLIEDLTAPPDGMFPTKKKKGKKKRKKLLAALAAAVGAWSGAFAAPDGEHRNGGEPNGISVVPDALDLGADDDKKARKKKKKKDR